MKYDIDNIWRVMDEKKYKFFQSQTKPFNVNLIGVRSSNKEANSFDDFLYVIYHYQNNWNQIEYQITTDPGTFWLENPEYKLGTAILKPGQYPEMWSIGYHRGLYQALVQTGPCTVYRDNNRDNILDMTNVIEETGWFGINCHKAGSYDVIEVDRWSAGCQVHRFSKRFDEEFMPMMLQASRNWGNKFTYTLLTEEDFKC